MHRACRGAGALLAPRILIGMARKRSESEDGSKTPGRFAQLRAAFTMTRQVDRAVTWWMLLGFLLPVVPLVTVGVLENHPIYFTLMSLPIGLLVAAVVLARRAERAAYKGLRGKQGASVAVLRNLRRGWTLQEEPVAADPRTGDRVTQVVGRAGVVLVTEGPLPRVARLSDQYRKRLSRLLPGVPVTVIHAGDDEGQVPLEKLSMQFVRMRARLDKNEVVQVSKRLRAVGAAKLPVPKGIDPMRVRPDRKATRGR